MIDSFWFVVFMLFIPTAAKSGIIWIDRMEGMWDHKPTKEEIIREIAK